MSIERIKDREPPYLRDVHCRNAVCPVGKPVKKLNDGDGLFLWVMPDGAKRWRYRYFVQKINRKGELAKVEQLLSVGVYPDTTLAQARVKATALREQADPGQARKDTKQAKEVAASNTFESVTRAWHAKHAAHWSVKHAHDLLSLLERFAFPLIGSKPVSELESPDILNVLERIEATGTIDTAHRMLPIFGRILSYGKAKGFCQHIVSNDINAQDSLKKAIKKKHAAVTSKDLPALLRAIDVYPSQQTRLALKLVFLVFTRASEMLGATWDEIDLDNALWRIPETRMKKRLALLVPLAPQAVAILKELQPLSCGSQWVFPGRSHDKPMSSNALLSAFERMGYAGVMTTHGVRRIASTTLNEAVDSEERPIFNSDAVERQLAHVPESIRAVYNEAEYLGQRRKMMQWWSDHLNMKAKEGI